MSEAVARRISAVPMSRHRDTTQRAHAAEPVGLPCAGAGMAR
jgi:hypothetical protein